MIIINILFIINDFNNFNANLKNQIAKNWYTKTINIKDYFIHFYLALALKCNSKWYKIYYFYTFIIV